MSNGGTVIINSTNNKKLRADREYIAPLLEMESESQALATADEIIIEEPSSVWAEHLIENYPEISWCAFMSELCEDFLKVVIYLSPNDAESSVKPGVYTMFHVDYEPVIRTSHRSKDEYAYEAFKLVEGKTLLL